MSFLAALSQSKFASNSSLDKVVSFLTTGFSSNFTSSTTGVSVAFTSTDFGVSSFLTLEILGFFTAFLAVTFFFSSDIFRHLHLYLKVSKAKMF